MTSTRRDDSKIRALIDGSFFLDLIVFGVFVANVLILQSAGSSFGRSSIFEFPPTNTNMLLAQVNLFFAIFKLFNALLDKASG